MSLNLFSKLCVLFSILAIAPFLSSQAQQAQKSIDPARQLDPVRSLFAQSNVGGKETQDQIDVIDDTTNGIVQEFRQNYQQ